MSRALLLHSGGSELSVLLHNQGFVLANLILVGLFGTQELPFLYFVRTIVVWFV